MDRRRDGGAPLRRAVGGVEGGDEAEPGRDVQRPVGVGDAAAIGVAVAARARGKVGAPDFLAGLLVARGDEARGVEREDAPRRDHRHAGDIVAAGAALADLAAPGDAEGRSGSPVLDRLFGVASGQGPVGLGLGLRQGEVDALPRGGRLQGVGGGEDGNPRARTLVLGAAVPFRAGQARQFDVAAGTDPDRQDQDGCAAREGATADHWAAPA